MGTMAAFAILGEFRMYLCRKGEIGGRTARCKGITSPQLLGGMGGLRRHFQRYYQRAAHFQYVGVRGQFRHWGPFVTSAQIASAPTKEVARECEGPTATILATNVIGIHSP